MATKKYRTKRTSVASTDPHPFPGPVPLSEKQRHDALEDLYDIAHGCRSIAALIRNSVHFCPAETKDGVEFVVTIRALTLAMEESVNRLNELIFPSRPVGASTEEAEVPHG